MSTDLIEQVYGRLLRHELSPADLSARRLGACLGKTTGALYHHFGSLDGLLYALGQRGLVDLRADLEKVFLENRDLRDVAEAFVEFGLDHPELYSLMFERRFDWNALRRAGAFEEQTPGHSLHGAVRALLEAAGSADPAMDTRLLWAGLHGLVSLAASGRANTGELDRSDRDVARSAARALVERLLPRLHRKDASE